MHLDELWERHTRHLKLRRRSPYTLTYYAATARTLGLPERPGPQPPGGRSDRRRPARLHGTSGAGRPRHRRHRRPLPRPQGLFWAVKDEWLSLNPTARLERIKPSQRLMLTLTGDEYSCILAIARKAALRDRETALILVLFDTGLRLAEIMGLRLDNVRFTEGHLRVTGKGDKERFVPLGQRSSGALDRYIHKGRKAQHTGITQVFVSRTGTPLTRSGVSQVLADLAEQAGVPRARAAPHAFRRAFALNYLRNGGDVFTLQRVMGHTTLDMTRRYVQLLPEDLARVHAQVSPTAPMGAPS